MVKTALLSVDLERGREVLEALDRANIKVSVALWAYLSEYEDWRLIVSGRQFDSAGVGNAYKMLNDSLDSAGMAIEIAPVVMILPMTDIFIKGLRRMFAKSRNVDGMRLGGQLFGDRFVEDGVAYRIG